MEEKLWEYSPRTEAKHEIIRNYMQAWLPIMSTYNKRILYFDGFCGPGEYKGGEKGSPIVALETALNHKAERVLDQDIVWLFVDKDERRIEHLINKLKQMEVPDNYYLVCENSTFEEAVERINDELEEQKAQLAPAFIFIDPFGYGHHPMSQVRSLMENDKCEVLINYMFDHVNRFITETPEAADRLFGSERWRKIEDIRQPDERNDFLLSLYREQLEDYADIDYVREFEIRRGDRPSYYLFFGTNELRGLEKMTAAMWDVDSRGGYSISDATYGTPTLFRGQEEPPWNEIKRVIKGHLGDRELTIDDLLNWLLIHEGYKKAGIKGNVLKEMEQEGEIEVIESPRKRRFSYPEGTVLKVTGG